MTDAEIKKRLKGRRILIVDDEEIILRALSISFRQRGCLVLTAKRANKALELFDRLKFNLVISDIRMPGMSGMDFFQECRLKRPDMPFVLMTGFIVEEDIKELIEQMGVHLLKKPFDVNMIVETAARLLSKSQACD